MKCAEERRNLIRKLSLTLKVAINSIRMYEVNTKDNTCYKDVSEIKAGVYHEVTAKKQKTMHKMWDMPWKKRKTATLLTWRVEGATAYFILMTIVSQRHMYNKGETHSAKKLRKGSSYKAEEKKPTQISLKA